MARLDYDGPATLKANQLFRCRLAARIEEEIKAGGRLCVASRHVSDIGDAQSGDPGDVNHVAFRAIGPGGNAAGAVLELSPEGGQHPWNRGFTLRVSEGALRPGDTVHIEMGARGGFRAQSFSEAKSGFRLGIRQAADAPWRVSPKESAAMFRVTGAEAACARAYVKDATGAGPAKTVCVKLEDAYGNIGVPSGPVALDILLDDRTRLGRLEVPAGGVAETDLDLPVDGQWHELALSSEDGRFFARTNRFGPSPAPGLKALFGDLHSQSGLCDGTNPPDHLYRYARTAAGLDFASVTSHDMEMDGRAWDEIRRATLQANDPGRFATILGYEWSGSTATGGDHNVYYRGDDGPLVRNCSLRHPWCAPEAPEESQDLAQTISRLRREAGEFMVIPHGGGRRANFGYYDPSVMPVFEIHSVHRNFEHLWREAVGRGLKMGLCGGSDDHRGAPGDCRLTARDRYFSGHCGLMGVYARELARDALWEAVQRRHTFATNGPHMVVHLGLESRIMGDEVAMKTGQTAVFRFGAVAHGFLDRLEMYRDLDLIGTFCAADQQNRVTEYAGSLEDAVRPGPHFYWLKALQIDGGAAWTSPIFVVGE